MRRVMILGIFTIGLLTGCSGGEPMGGDTPGGGDKGAKFPFPQNVQSERCTYPTGYSNADVQAAYDIWKQDIVTSEGASGFRRVRRPDTPDGLANSTVSEGIAYGMLLSVYMNDQPLFDDLWQYSQLWLDGSGLMKWYIDPEGKTACPGEEGVCGAATDSDEDIAFALVMADRQWGGKGSLDESYIELARKQIGRIWSVEVDSQNVLRPGDTWGGAELTNPSYFAPAYYRVFGEVTGEVDKWKQVIDTSYEIIEASLNDKNGNTTNGLVPAWCTAEGEPKSVDGLPTHYQYDSARTPFRIGQDYCWNGEPRAEAYLEKVNGFFSKAGPDNIIDGYDLDGTPRPEAAKEGSRSAVFVGCAGVGAMSDAKNQALIDGTYKNVAKLDLLVRSRYYQRSWTAMSLLMMTGSFLDYTKMP
jgi:endo-1,4-beta-D-glucanase Y